MVLLKVLGVKCVAPWMMYTCDGENRCIDLVTAVLSTCLYWDDVEMLIEAASHAPMPHTCMQIHAYAYACSPISSTCS